MTITAELLTIGDELLYGQVVNTNAAWMGTELGARGVRVVQITSVSDDPAAIVGALDAARRRANAVLITGGLGPTKDDLTKHVLARYFASELVLHEPTLRHVEDIFARFNRPMLDVNRAQAFVPAACDVVPNPLGTAPGMWFEAGGVVFVSMPGVPFEMKRMMTDTVLPRLTERFQPPALRHRVVQTVGLGESFLAQTISAWEDALPAHLKLAYLPNMGQLRLRLTGLLPDGMGAGALDAEMATRIAALYPLIGEYIFAEGEIPLEEAIGQRLIDKNLTIGTAESCTGGHVAHRLTGIAGSSAYFRGGIVAYDNQVKQLLLNVQPATLATYGAVSEETVREMAEGARGVLGVDVALATSGVAGPGGGTPEKPVGTICIAVADAAGTVSRRFNFDRGRSINIEYTTVQVLEMVRRRILAQG
ncbi:MAG: competence/damage-inducible protein A [Hymenobacteraceae bacterium]|nr:competence/damage-inducible protein A [Hymenobacteraceae bacterium]